MGVVGAGETVAPRAGGVCFDFLVLLMAIISARSCNFGSCSSLQNESSKTKNSVPFLP